MLTRFISDKHAEAMMFRCGFALYLAVILLGSIPGARDEVGEMASGLVLHFTTYACGAAGNITARAIKAFCIVAVMGAADEAIQSFLPYRDGAVADWMIDVSAALLTMLAYRIIASEKVETAP